jgi:hypothetical protein
VAEVPYFVPYFLVPYFLFPSCLELWIMSRLALVFSISTPDSE